MFRGCGRLVKIGPTDRTVVKRLKPGRRFSSFQIQAGDPWLEGLPHALFGEVARNQGDYQEAQTQYATCLALMQQAGDERHVAFMLHDLVQVAQRQGDFDQARVLHVEALEIHQKSRPSRAVAFGLEMLAVVAGASGKPIKAARLLGAAEVYAPIKWVSGGRYRASILYSNDFRGAHRFRSAILRYSLGRGLCHDIGASRCFCIERVIMGKW
jgi:tetratricopeptide (TPR) repeat protein